MLTKAAFIKIIGQHHEILLYFKIYIFFILVYFMLFIPVIAKLNFQHHYSSLQCHMILQKSI